MKVCSPQSFWLPAPSGEQHAYRYYANVDAGMKIMRVCCLGGTTTVSAGNAVRCLEAELAALGIDLSHEFAELESELGVRVLPDDLLGAGTLRLMGAARRLGLPPSACPSSSIPTYAPATDSARSAAPHLRGGPPHGSCGKQRLWVRASGPKLPSTRC